MRRWIMVVMVALAGCGGGTWEPLPTSGRVCQAQACDVGIDGWLLTCPDCSTGWIGCSGEVTVRGERLICAVTSDPRGCVVQVECSEMHAL